MSSSLITLFIYFVLVKVLGMRGPIFIDGPHFNIALRLFHGRGGVAPLSGSSSMSFDNMKSDSSQQFNPLAAKAATISLSGIGTGGPFGFDSFSQNQKNKNNKKSKVKTIFTRPILPASI